MKAGLPTRQKGAAAIEFAMVFVIFFAVFYAVVSYSLPLLMMQSFNEATSEAVRRCVALDPASATYSADIDAKAKEVLTQQLAWMPNTLGFALDTDATVTLSPAKLLTVRIDYPKGKLGLAIPFLILPGIGEVPRLPDNLSAEASLQL
ncbi:pilus assembly protein [Pseudomonas sp. LS1212]|uniref:TadE/TadG family type IV pilus assembly protein n=1 Tax=Pseudomonas sp. LS1212 TaxID=2972478 RepID=UPI00215CD447|nr:TadE/TadG family type IV pilus assembly protein [Pseudomonas sp. LS1212]UVJ44588.1 pilus assembly protein [Pseudomonas sp. LS1212]